MKDPSLRSISPLARGVWIDILCVMFESEKRGYLQINGKAPSEEQIARMVGCSGDEISRAMSELREASVFSTTANGVIYSRRIVRDEEIRNKRSKSGTLGGNPSFQKGKPNPYYEKDKQNHNQGDKQKITPSSSSSSSSSDSKENSKDKDGAGKFVPPSPQEVSEYGKTIGFQIDGEKFVAFYQASGWYRGKSKIKDWKAAVVTWKSKSQTFQNTPKPIQKPQDLDAMLKLQGLV